MRTVGLWQVGGVLGGTRRAPSQRACDGRWPLSLRPWHDPCPLSPPTASKPREAPGQVPTLMCHLEDAFRGPTGSPLNHPQDSLAPGVSHRPLGLGHHVSLSSFTLSHLTSPSCLGQATEPPPSCLYPFRNSQRGTGPCNSPTPCSHPGLSLPASLPPLVPQTNPTPPFPAGRPWAGCFASLGLQKIGTACH